MKIKKYLPVLLSTVCVYGSTFTTPAFQHNSLSSASALTIAQNNVNGYNVKRVEYGNSRGFFQQQPDNSWIEKNSDGQFTFKEIARDEWSVYLLKSDGLRIQLDLYRKEVIWMGKGKLYDINFSSTVVKAENIPVTNKIEKVDFSVLTYNVMLLDSTAFPNHKQQHRAQEIPQAIRKNGRWDVIVINEAFLNSARSTLQDGLKQIGYKYITKVVDERGNLDDGGVFIASRLPILKSEILVFDDCSGSDCLSNKGAMYVKVQKEGKVVHLFGTHLQSSRGTKEANIRQKQLRQLKSFIQRQAPNAKAKGEAVIISGDLNFDDRIDASEYRNTLSTLGANLYGNRPSGYTFDPQKNSIAKYRYEGEKQEWLDYTLIGNEGIRPSNVRYNVMKFKTSKKYNMPAVGDPLGWFDRGTDHYDLSDHYGLSAKFTF